MPLQLHQVDLLHSPVKVVQECFLELYQNSFDSFSTSTSGGVSTLEFQ